MNIFTASKQNHTADINFYMKSLRWLSCLYCELKKSVSRSVPENCKINFDLKKFCGNKIELFY